MKKIKSKILIILLTILVQDGFPQGFVNLNFENAIIVNDPQGSYPFSVYASNAIPGWTAYLNGVPQTDIIYNTRPLDAAEVTLQGTNSDSLTPIQGKFTVELFGASIFAPQQSAAIGQTGQIPATSQSLIFWGYSAGVLFGGQNLSLVVLGSTPNYNIYGADVSVFAGQTGQLLFTAQPGSFNIIDNIQFSNQSIPEPSTLALGALGAFLLGFRRWKKSLR